jgi:hypothetical protein
MEISGSMRQRGGGPTDRQDPFLWREWGRIYYAACSGVGLTVCSEVEDSPDSTPPARCVDFPRSSSLTPFRSQSSRNQHRVRPNGAKAASMTLANCTNPQTDCVFLYIVRQIGIRNKIPSADVLRSSALIAPHGCGFFGGSNGSYLF